MNLRAQAFSAGRWTSASLLLRALLQFAQTMILARLLTPADFGVMAITLAVYGVISLFVDLGLSNALIHFPERTARILSSLYWLNLGAALIMMLLLMIAAWPLAKFYDQSELIPVILLISLAMPLSAAGQQFRVLAEKDLRFHTLAGIEVASAIAGFACAILVAMLDGGVYSLVAAIVTTSAISSLLAWACLSKGLRPGFHFNLQEIKPHLGFGSYRLADTLLISAQMQVDILIGGAVAGSAAMGVYTLPRDLTLRLANTVVNPVVTRVGLPIMARVQADRSALKSIYLQTMRLTSSINFPIYAATALWAELIVAVVLGPQWHEAVDFMRVFAIWGLLRSTANPVGSLLNATGNVRRAFWWDLALLAIVPALMYLGAFAADLHGLAISLLLVQCAAFYPHYRFLVRPACGATFLEYVGALAPPMICTTFSVAAAWAAMALPIGQVYILAGISMTVGACVYLVGSILINKAWLRAMMELLSPLRRSPGAQRSVKPDHML
ncbi:TPA: MOP flippase family protein [Stenotrophomonas maltophilia]|nr:MOP flippase family protein [Stenotrophomonas maltophilia]HDS1158337.1 MOP flippase family protein [Stenotrophomonas maltophilia]HDS1165653.1 MOP flippase family protein [Stenotrophomonas maltophilia]HDS1171383.1 MOP flippase family protein [Stenotrophomonas maltophilia]HDS1174722.1 MOP flippase family protein [Stenotrophomonas maltophilia]